MNFHRSFPWQLGDGIKDFWHTIFFQPEVASFGSSTRLAYLHLRFLTYPFSIPDDSASNAIPWDRFPLPVHPSGNEAPEVWPKVWMQNVPTLQSQSDLSIFILLRSKQKEIL